MLLELLYVPALAVLLSPLACDVIHAHTQGRAAVNKIFTDHTCYAGKACFCAERALDSRAPLPPVV